MKKLILILQILIFTSQSVSAQSNALPATSPVTSAPIIPEAPIDFKPRRGHLVDSSTVNFYMRYKNQVGQRVEVKGHTVNLGANFSKELLQQIHEAEITSEVEVEHIYTLPSTIEDAKVMKRLWELEDKRKGRVRKLNIVVLPEEMEQKVMRQAELQAQGGLTELWEDTKDKVGKLVNIRQTISDYKKNLAYQYVKPNRNDFHLARVSVTAAAVTSGLLMWVGNIDPAFVLSMLAMRVIIGGTTQSYKQTSSNFFRMRLDINKEFYIIPEWQQALTKLTTMSGSIGEFYYFLGSYLSGLTGTPFKLTQRQFLTNLFTSGFVETIGTQERDSRLSDKANYRIALYNIIIGSAISAAAIIGKTGPVLFEYGVVQVNVLLAGTVAMYTGFLFSYVFFTKQVERMAQHDFMEIAQKKLQRLWSFREARDKRLQLEHEAAERRTKAMEEALMEQQNIARANREYRSLNPRYPRYRRSALTCSSLFR